MLSCASDAHEEMREESMEMMTESMDYTRAQYTGQHWDLRTWKQPSDNKLFYPWVFSKTLKHDAATGLPLVKDVTTLLAAVQCPSAASVAAIKLNPLSRRKLEGIVNSADYTMLGGDPRALHPPIVWPIDSAERAFEMAEVYAMALLRDTNFIEWESSTKIATIVDFLNGFAAKTTAPIVDGRITPRTLLRGGVPGCTIGPYVSQFMLHDFWYGGAKFVQEFAVEPDTNNGLTWQGWLDIQNGVTDDTSTLPAGEAIHVHSPRVLGSNVHVDPPSSWYFNAAQIAGQMGIDATGIQSSISTSWATAGYIGARAPPSPRSTLEARAATHCHVFGSVNHVTIGAMRVAWHTKWSMIMQIRPEVLAQRLELVRKFPELVNGKRPIPGLAAIQQNMQAASGLLQMVFNDNKKWTGGEESLLLALQYPEGSPTHPSHPGTSRWARDGRWRMSNDPKGDARDARGRSRRQARPAEASALGDVLIVYEGEDVSEMTVNGELNKLGTNIALSRDWAGVHFRTDGDGGLLLGEEFAIAYLVDKAREYCDNGHGMFNGWLLEKFSGDVVRITSQGVAPVPPL
ncbi:phosphatidic acid phosphatase type 2/haloperoxidase [Pavlovales sp. CCMP2436]|nr:phosphatidic acid phosphatase type 2/haloperoxidase [Pavlovales sp. CCMP2436]